MSRFFSQCKKELASYLVSSLVWAAVGVSLAFILQFITNTAVSMEKKNFPVIVVLVVGYLVLDMLFEFLMGHTKYRSRTKLSMLLRGAIVHRIEVLDLDEKERYGDAHYLSLVNNDVTEVETGYVDGILSVIFQLFSLLFALAATTYIEPMLTVIAILLCVLPIIVPKLLQKKLVQVNRTALTEKSRYLNVVNELLQGFLTLRVFRRFPQYNQYHDKQNKTLVSALWRNNQWKRLSMSLSYGVGNLVVQGAWVAGLAFALSGKITGGCNFCSAYR